MEFTRQNHLCLLLPMIPFAMNWEEEIVQLTSGKPSLLYLTCRSRKTYGFASLPAVDRTI